MKKLLHEGQKKFLEKNQIRKAAGNNQICNEDLKPPESYMNYSSVVLIGELSFL